MLATADETVTSIGREYILKEALEPIKDKYDYIVIDNPALRFITHKEDPKEDTPKREIKQENKAPQSIDVVQEQAAASSVVPLDGKEEQRSKRTSVAMTPSLYDDLTKVALYERKKLNDLINEALQEYVTANRVKIEKIEDMDRQLYGK